MNLNKVSLFFKNIYSKFLNSKKNVSLERKLYNFYPELILISIYSFLILIFYLTNDLSFFGNKKSSFFDFWSFIHILSGGTLSFFAFKLRSFKLKNPILLVLLISVYWEVLEVYIEDGLIFSEISFWFSGKENFFNRFFSDQLSILIGFLIIKFNPKLYYWFVVFIFFFVLFHIYVGTSTYLI